EEVAVVRDDEAGAVPATEELLKPLEHLEVEVVRRLVEKEEVRVGQQRLGEGDSGLLATAEAGDGIIELVLREAEALQDFVGAVLDVVAAGGLEADAQPVVLLHERFKIDARLGHLVLDLAHPLLHLKDRREGEPGLVAQRVIAREVRLLRQVGDAQTSSRDDLARVRMLDTGDDAEHGRLAGAVDADKGDVLPLLNLERDIGEDLVRDVGLGEIGNGENGKRWHSWQSSAG